MREFDVIVIGGGLLGCFAARALTRFDLKVALLEKREDVCTGISRANMAIVYSGCDMKPGTRKAEMCVSAAQGFQALCEELGVRYSACGSVMVCFGERGAGVLRKKFEQGTLNGVRGMRLLTRDEVLELEPNVAESVHSGLFVPDTGTVIPWELCFAAAENAVGNGAEIFLDTEAVGVERGEFGIRNSEFGISMNDGCVANGGQSIDGELKYTVKTNKGDFRARAVINCAGLSADRVLEMAFEPTVRIVPSASDFYVLDTKAAGHIRHVIFHEPEQKGKGLTLVPTVDGNILVGSTERKIAGGLNSEPFATEREGLEQLRSLAAAVMPALPLEHIISSFGAVRPNPFLMVRDEDGQLVVNDKSINEFPIIESDDGAFISFVGVKTPGLTCSGELGEYAAQKIAAQLCAAPNAQFDPCRKPAPRLSELPPEERDALIRENPDYGRIVCRCRETSEGEIIDAIRRTPGAVTLDGIKRRTAADSGRCQGGYCTQRIIEVLARELGRTVEEITKDGGKSRILSP